MAEFSVTEDKTGVFVLICKSCGHVLTAKHTREEIKRERRYISALPRKTKTRLDVELALS